MNEMSTKFQLTADNYYSDEANREYLSVSQFKDFVGTYGRIGCEEMALAKIRGEYKTEPSNAMMIGSYVDSYYEGTLNEFRTKNPHIFRKDGKLLSGFQKAEDIIVSGSLEINTKKHEVKADGEVVGLTLKEYELLKRLMENPNIVMTRDSLLEEIWGYDFDGETRTVDVHIRTLRQKLGKCGERVETVRGVGYRISE